MGYIESNLMSDERIAYRTKVHWAIFIGPVVMLVIALVPVAMSRRVYQIAGSEVPGGADVSAFGPFLLWVGVILLAFAIGWGIWAFIALKSREFAITNKRVLTKIGWIGRRAEEIFLTKIESIEVHQSILGRLLNCGTVVVTGTGGQRNAFEMIESPLSFRKEVQNAAEPAQQKD